MASTRRTTARSKTASELLAVGDALFHAGFDHRQGTRLVVEAFKVESVSRTQYRLDRPCHHGAYSLIPHAAVGIWIFRDQEAAVRHARAAAIRHRRIADREVKAATRALEQLR